MSEPVSNKTHVSQGISADFKIKVIGVGGAGSNALDRLILDGSVNVDLVACNTDVQALAGSVAAQKVQLGRHVTRGLGAGGDPELGFTAAEEAAEEMRGLLQGIPLVIVCTGLGGGTGSGAAPLIVKIAREQNSLVLVCATLPFSFEGRRRSQQAQEALNAIQQHADAVMCFENDRMGELILPESGIHEAFAGADQIISQSVRSIIELVNRRGLIHLGFDDLLSALRSHDSRCLFGYGEAGGRDRGKEALRQALRNPLMDRGSLLGQSANVLVNIVGGQDLTLAEVQAVMEELAQHIGDQTQLLFGAAVDAKLDGRLGVTLISSLSGRPNGAAAPATGASTAGTRSTAQTAVHPPLPPVPGSAPADDGAAGKGAAPEEAAIRGRFDKGEPTIIDGEDLDVPTFMRKNLKVK
jgi:cell division protein FtsZ